MGKYLELNRLEFLVTYRCSSQCAHCCNAAGNDESPVCIDTSIAVSAVEEIGSRYNLESLMTFGGEPLLYPDVVCAIHAKAASMGIPQREIITNACWTKDEKKICEIANMLADADVNRVLISVDAFHQQFISLETVIFTAKALLDSGIPEIKWNPCWLTSPDTENSFNIDTRRILSELTGLGIPISRGNVVAFEGRAVTALRDHFPQDISFTEERCQDKPYMDKLDDIRCICIEPNGDIPICQRFILGNLADGSMVDMLESYNPYAIPELENILKLGVPKLPGFNSLCDMCCSGNVQT